MTEYRDDETHDDIWPRGLAAKRAASWWDAAKAYCRSDRVRAGQISELVSERDEVAVERDIALWLLAEQRWLRDMEKLQRAVNDMHSRVAVAGQVDDAIASVGALDPIFEDLARLIAAYKSAYDREPPSDVAGHMMFALLRERGWQRSPAVLLRAEDCDCAPPWADCMHGPEPVDALDFMRWLHAEAVFFGHGWHDQWMATRKTAHKLRAELNAYLSGGAA